MSTRCTPTNLPSRRLLRLARKYRSKQHHNAATPLRSSNISAGLIVICLFFYIFFLPACLLIFGAFLMVRALTLQIINSFRFEKTCRYSYDIDFKRDKAALPSISHPDSFGGCWRQLFDPDPDALITDFQFNGWMPSFAFKRLAMQTGSLIPLVKISHQVYHVSFDHPHAKLYRPSRIPMGWYGMRADAFDGSALKTTVLAMHIQDYTKSLTEGRAQAPYAVKPTMLKHLERAGIQPPVDGALSHPHPIHYAYENRMLQLAGNAIRGQPWFALFLRPEKIGRMRNSVQLNPPTGYFNPVYDGKDITRYNQTPGGVSSGPTPRSDSPVWFAHDVLHHMNPSSVGEWFDNNPTLKYLFATAVIPPELVAGTRAQSPRLYNFELHGDTMTYIPEQHNAGAYLQPRTCAQWLTANRMVTPERECLHVARVDGIRAHNLFVISRPQLIPTSRTLLDMPEIAVIPQTVHPLGSLDDRLTDPALMEHLVDYATRATATNVRDLYAKTASHAAERYGSFPPGYTRAAVLNAVQTRLLDWHSKLSKWDYIAARLAFFTGLPIASLNWLAQSQSSKAFSRMINGASIWTVPMTTWVSQPSDSVLPGLRNHLCDAHDVPFFYVPPKPTLAARFSAFNAAVHVSVGGKMLGVFLWWLLKKTAPQWFPILNRTAYLLGLNWHDTPFGVVLVALLYFFGLRVPSPPLYPFRTTIWCWLKRAYAWYFFLPSSRSGFNAGLSLPYQLCLTLTTVTKFFPRLNPVYAYNRSNKVHFYLMLGTFSLQLLVAFITVLFVRHRNTLPHHGQMHHHIEEGPEPYHDDTPPPPDASTIPDDPAPPPSPGLLPEWVFVDHPPDNTAAAVPVVPAAPAVMPPIGPNPVAEPIPLQPMLAGDNLATYKHSPENFLSNRTFAAVADGLPAPPLLPDPDTMCVWECLGPTLGVSPVKLLAFWLASLAPVDRVPMMGGAVPRDQLEPIFAFFGVGVTLRNATMDNQDCPRAPGAQTQALNNPNRPPLSESTARPGWPSVTYYVGRALDGDFHLCSTAGMNTNAPGAEVPNHDHLIGYRSRSVPLVEIKDILNVPVKIWNTSYHRLTGNLANAASAFHNRFQQVRTYRAAFNALPVNPVRTQSLRYQPTLQDAVYARNLATDMKNNPQTLNLRDMNAHAVAVSFDALAKMAERQINNGTFMRNPVELVIFHGAGGSGKTTALSNYLQTTAPAGGYNSSNVRFHTWLNQLRGPLERRMMQQPWVQAANLVAHNFSTGVMPLVQPFGGTLVLDDATQCWAGFIQLLVMTNPGIDRIVVTMDATQGRTTFPEADSLSRADPSTAEWLSAKSDYYATEVYRYPREVGDVFGMPTAPPQPGRPVREGRIYVVSRAPRDVPLLVVSPRFSETQNNGGTRCLTFRECQGQDIEGDIAIDLGGLTSTATEHAVWTALTRAQGNVFLVLGASMSQTPTLVETTYGNSQILSAILCVAAANQTAEITINSDPDRLIARAVHNHLASCLSPAARGNLGLPVATPIVGKQVNATIRSDWLCEEDRYAIGDYYTARTHRSKFSPSRTSASAAFSRHNLKTYAHGYDLKHALRHVAIVHNDLNLHAAETDYIMPPAPILTSSHDPINNFDRQVDDASREIVANSVDTSFQHIHDGPQAMLHHNGQDRVTQKVSEAKRIRRGVDKYELNTTEKKKLQQMKKGFGKFFDIDSWNTEGMHVPTFTSSGKDFLAPWVSKRTRKAIDRSIERDPGDIPFNFTRLFLKGQYIKKEDKRYRKALPGQIVSEFPLGKQFRDAPFALYLERMALRHAYSSTYLHARASPADTSHWYKQHWKRGPITANDYTAWDNGCDRTTVAFVDWLMGVSGMPREYIDQYVFDRMNTYSHLGPHMTKQESGDRYTWIVNSLVNAAITGASLNCPRGTPLGVSGDDSIVCGSWRTSTHFNPDDWLMKPKPERGNKLTFCGMLFGGVDVHFDTVVIMHRAQNGLALGRSDPDYWRSISDSIREAGSKAPDYDVHLASAEHYLLAAQRMFDFNL